VFLPLYCILFNAFFECICTGSTPTLEHTALVGYAFNKLFRPSSHYCFCFCCYCCCYHHYSYSVTATFAVTATTTTVTLLLLFFRYTPHPAIENIVAIKPGIIRDPFAPYFSVTYDSVSHRRYSHTQCNAMHCTSMHHTLE